MGVSITAYKNIELIQCNQPIRQRGNLNLINIDIGQDWLQGCTLKKGQIYQYQDKLNIFYMPYSSYNEFKNELARIAGYEPVFHAKYPYSQRVWNDYKNTQSILSELIYFPDNLGEIDCCTCKKILKDLLVIQKMQFDLSNCHKENLNELIQTFSFVCDNGLVKFH